MGAVVFAGPGSGPVGDAVRAELIEDAIAFMDEYRDDLATLAKVDAPVAKTAAAPPELAAAPKRQTRAEIAAKVKR